MNKPLDQTRTCEEATIGYDLDAGGYAFEPAPLALVRLYKAPNPQLAPVVWDDYDRDYFPFSDATEDLNNPLLAFYALEPCQKSGVYPESFYSDDHGRMTLRDQGHVAGSDRECYCAQNDDDDAHTCDRCEDTGYYDSPAGHWAVYSPTNDQDRSRENEARIEATFQALVTHDNAAEYITVAALRTVAKAQQIHGSGIDYDWELDATGKAGARLSNAFHIMNEHGYYVAIQPFTLHISTDGSLNRVTLKSGDATARYWAHQTGLREYLEDLFWEACR